MEREVRERGWRGGKERRGRGDGEEGERRVIERERSFV